jgi:hypothetical protein
MPVKVPSKAPKGEPPRKAETRGNDSKPEPARIVPLNFRVTAEIKRDIKIAAAVHGISQSSLLIQMFEEWQQKHGSALSV